MCESYRRHQEPGRRGEATCFLKSISQWVRRTLKIQAGLRRYLLALCVVILYQVLEEVHSFLGLNLIYFDQVLQSKERSRVQPGVDIQGVFKGFFGLMRYNVAEL